jgi:hypothetical protein
METTTPPPPTDARCIAERLATGPQVAFPAQGFRLKVKGAPLSGRAYVGMSPVRTETAARLLGGMRGCAA